MSRTSTHSDALDALPADARAHVEESLALAADLYAKAGRSRSRRERAQDAERERMVRDAAGKETLIALLDRAFRSRSAAATAQQIVGILRDRDAPSFFPWYQRMGLALFCLLATWFPTMFVAAMKAVMRRKTAEVILPGDHDRLVAHIKERQRSGVQLNVNHLGEMILGEREADQKLQEDLVLLADPAVECVSVKASNLYSQVSALAHDESSFKMCDRLFPRLDAAMQHRRASYDAATAPAWDRGYKLVNLDMEEYRDLAITVDAFILAMNDLRYFDLQIGIAIQAYVPESFRHVQRLVAAARSRTADGGAPIRIRVVKGANRAMELVESSQRGLANPTYDEKADTDANWKRIVEFLTRPENAAACHLGIASHNIFDVAWASVLVRRRGVQDTCLYEMLEGMVDHVHRQVQEDVGDVLLYAPAVTSDRFLTAIAYLIRRFDELTDPANFLSHAFGVRPGTSAWDALAASFIESVRRTPTLDQRRKRMQDRINDPHDAAPVPSMDAFRNEPDTDWTAPANQAFMRHVRTRIKRIADGDYVHVPLGVPAADPDRRREVVTVMDRSARAHGVGTVVLADADDIDQALATATAVRASWTDRPPEHRDAILAQAAANLSRARGRLIALCAMDVGKSFDQADSEISEAIDFGRYYPLSLRELRKELPGMAMGPLGNGVVVVVPPWNFPVAIPAGGVFAALAAGNRVILKPSPESMIVTSAIADCFWNAGVPRGALQVVNCRNEHAARLVADPRVDGVIFTGGTATADRILEATPGLRLFAETGGKNVTIVTEHADRELAIRHIADSFRADGQKCSATSIVLALPDVYDDPRFWEQLVDAVASLRVGSAWDPWSVITPLVRDPLPELRRGLTTLEEGEEWVLRPQRVHERDDFWTPGIKRGTQRRSFTATTELFGPVITVMRATSLADALAIMDETGRGLTFGIESLDEDEVAYALARAQAGVLYANRNTVGAIVQRQSFGGWKGSRRGPGIHAGGPNYVTNVMSFEERTLPYDPIVTAEELRRCGAGDDARALAELLPAWERRGAHVIHCPTVRNAIRSYLAAWRDVFSREHRPSTDVRGEENLHRYHPLGTVTVRITPADTVHDAFCMVAAALIAGNRVEISIEPHCSAWWTLTAIAPELVRLRSVKVFIETDNELSMKLAPGTTDLLRVSGPDRIPHVLSAAAARAGIHVCREPVLHHGRIELLRYLQEQTVAHVYHRYGGNLREKDRD